MWDHRGRAHLDEVRELLSSQVTRDALTAIVRSSLGPASGHVDAVTTQLVMAEVLLAEAAATMAADADPLGLSDAGQTAPSEQQAVFESVAALAHRVMNQAGAVRAHGVARCARFDLPAGASPVHGSAVDCGGGHRGEFAGAVLGPALKLGSHEADSLVDECVWLTSRTPKLLDAVGAGESNLATAATIARELQDASPATCELVEDTVLKRHVHRRSRHEARRSTRVLVARHEAAAARRVVKREAEQRIGVWLDPHPTPGLSTLTATMPTPFAAALMDAVEQRAEQLHQAGTCSHLLGQHRAKALVDLALRNVTFAAHIEVLGVPTVMSELAPSELVPSELAPSELVPAGLESSKLAPSGLAPSNQPAAVGAARGLSGSDDLSRSRESRPRGLGRDELTQLINDLSLVVHDRAGPFAPADLLGLFTERSEQLRRITTNRQRDAGPVLVGEAAAGVAAWPPISPGYRPPQSMRDRIRRRDQTCRFPGCSRPATATDIDHVTPWPHGPTTDSNLQCLCRHHHRAKQAGWQVTMHADARCDWTSPTGSTHASDAGSLTIVQDLRALEAAMDVP